MYSSPGDGDASGVGGASMIETMSGSGTANGKSVPFTRTRYGTGSLVAAPFTLRLAGDVLELHRQGGDGRELRFSSVKD
jgi:hypothetical protein